MPWLLLLDDDEDDDDAEKVIAALVERGQWSRVVGGWRGTPRADDDPKRSATRARQARYRDRKRDAARRGATRSRDAARRGRATRRDAGEGEEFDEILGEDPSLPTPKGREVGRDTPENDADATRRARRDDATRRDADDDATRVAYGGPETWRVDPVTDADRELGRAKIRELGDALRGARAKGD